MKFGISPPNYAAWFDAEKAIEIAGEAERLGFDSIWLGDHVAIPKNQTDIFGNAYLDCFTLMGFLAGRTPLRLGTHVAVVPYRHPVLAAKIIATLDQLSHGRIVLGAGSGHVPGEAEALNTVYDERGAMTDEYLEVMTALWSQDVVSYHGRWVNFDDLCPLTRPVQQPFPLVIGGSGKVAMRRALRFHAAWTPMAATAENLVPLMRDLADLADAAGKPTPEVVVRVRLHLAEDPRSLAPSNPRNDIQRPRVTIEQAADVIGSMADLGVSEMIIDVPPGRRVYLQQLQTVAVDVLPRALPHVYAT